MKHVFHVWMSLASLLAGLAAAATDCLPKNGDRITVAAEDTPLGLKRHADYICDAKDARPILQKAIDQSYRLGVRCLLLGGTYNINSRGDRNKKGVICFGNPEKSERFYGQMRGAYHVLEGARQPFGWYGGTVLTMGKELFDSIPEDEEFSLFCSGGNNLFARGFTVRNIVVRLPGTRKPIVVFNAQASGIVRYEDCWVSALDPMKMNWATAEGIEVPHPRSVAFRGYAGSNIYSTEWKNCVAQGFGTGFDIGGEHVYCESLSALYNLYGFAFNCYKGKNSIDDPDAKKACGACVYPVYCVNLLDEHNVHMPRFGAASHDGRPVSSNNVQSITIRGMNLQWPNTAPGHTDRSAADFMAGRHRATEDQPGIWRGSIEYVIDHTTPDGGVNLTGEPFFEKGHGANVKCLNLTVQAGEGGAK